MGLVGLAIAPGSLAKGPALSHCAWQLLFNRKPSWAAHVCCRTFPSLAPALRAHRNKSTYFYPASSPGIREVPSLQPPLFSRRKTKNSGHSGSVSVLRVWLKGRVWLTWDGMEMFSSPVVKAFRWGGNPQKFLLEEMKGQLGYSVPYCVCCAKVSFSPGPGSTFNRSLFVFWTGTENKPDPLCWCLSRKRGKEKQTNFMLLGRGKL